LPNVHVRGVSGRIFAIERPVKRTEPIDRAGRDLCCLRFAPLTRCPGSRDMQTVKGKWIR
jgi:hypothetical protein